MFLATGVSIAVVVDLSRLSLYATHWQSALEQVADDSRGDRECVYRDFPWKTLSSSMLILFRFVVAWMLGSVAFLLILGVLCL